MKLRLVEDKAVDKEAYNTDYFWEKGAADIKGIIGKPIDAVFCGTDYLGTNRFESLYCPESEIIYFDRQEVPVSSTDIRKWAFDNWDYIPAVCRPYYAGKVLVVGGESTGKINPCKNLALAYNTCCVEEVGRDVTDFAGGEEWMIAEDFHQILLRHKVKGAGCPESLQQSIVCGHGCPYHQVLFPVPVMRGEEIRQCEALADAITALNSYDLILFLEPTVEFVQDGTRNERIAADREKYSRQIKELFEQKGLSYVSLAGDYLERFNRAKLLIKEKLGLDTRW